MRERAALVPQRDEHVVVEPVVARAGLGVHGLDRAEQREGLVDEVGAEVEQRAAAGPARPVLRRVPLEPRLEPAHLAQRAVVDQRLAP